MLTTCATAGKLNSLKPCPSNSLTSSASGVSLPSARILPTAHLSFSAGTFKHYKHYYQLLNIQMSQNNTIYSCHVCCSFSQIYYTKFSSNLCFSVNNIIKIYKNSHMPKQTPHIFGRTHISIPFHSRLLIYLLGRILLEYIT